ncbi:unnamed protein product [Spirodela intermedia]|uniref:Uncharacterized protein n=1 Tax=Spirodela intermedia TaxID=51605 RepID=A0A7I8IGC8_SPIIN|nr:unnamed protein product [Spirodela intermedia]CAA6656763.1 unnamed protein product [Spirodela intermedia]
MARGWAVRSGRNTITSGSCRQKTFSEPGIALYGDAKVVNSTVRITGPRTLRSEGRVMYGRSWPSGGGRASRRTSPSPSLPAEAKGPGSGSPFSWLRAIFVKNLSTVASSSPPPASCQSSSSSPQIAASGFISAPEIQDSGGEVEQIRILKALGGAGLVDLSALIWKSAMSVGVVGSSGGNSTTTTTLYSWTFWLKHAAAYRMHSDPLDPEEGLSSNPPEKVAHQPARPRADDGYLPGLLTGLFLGVACGAVVTFVAVAFVWAAFAGRRRHPVAPVEYPGAGKKATTVGDGGAGEDS